MYLAGHSLVGWDCKSGCIHETAARFKQICDENLGQFGEAFVNFLGNVKD